MAERRNRAAVDVVFVGSSILSEWVGLEDAFTGLTLRNSAVSGARTTDLLERVDELVLDHNPRLVVYYAGSNDISHDAPAPAVVDTVVATWDVIRGHLADTAFVYLSVLRAPQKHDRLDVVDAVNLRLLRRAFGSPNFHFVDINPLFENGDGLPRADYYREDGLHLTPAAYRALGAWLAPRLRSLLD